MPARQWFVRILDIKDELLEQGRRIQWHPAHMRARYEHWVEGLNQDWCVSRQRFAGVAFPVWYPVRGDGSVDYESPILAEAADLPLDPLATPPRGRREEERGKPGGFVGDPDVMDTWATSSLTPQIISGWGRDPERHRRLFPMDLRPQAHDIIRTWAFYTIVKAWLHERTVPWRHIAISGWGLDPDRKKMSKSKGNVVTPQHLFERVLGRRLPLLGGAPPPRHRHHLRSRGDPRRQAARDQAGQRQPLRAVAARSRRRRLLAGAGRGHHRGARPRVRRRPAQLWSRARRPRSTSSTTRCRCRRPRSCSGASATTSSSW